MQIHMKTPEFAKVLEQKLFRIVDLVGFDLSPDEFEQFWIFGIFQGESPKLRSLYTA